MVTEPELRREGTWIRYAAVILSLLLHAVLLARFDGVPVSTVSQPDQSIVQLSFPESEPEPVKPPAVQPEREPEKPRLKSKPDPKPVQKVVERLAVEKTVQKLAVEPAQEVVGEVIQQPVVVTLTEPAPLAQPIAEPQIDDGMIQRETERYIAKMMAHVEQYKRYPKAARRRGLEGNIIVRFTLFPDGTIDQLIVESGPSLLVSAARQAVERAMPMPIPPATIHCPLECQFRMAFQLKRS